MSAETTPTEEIREAVAEATKGPWGWFGSNKGPLYLAQAFSDRRYVMTFQRLGMGLAQPCFQLDDEMQPATKLAVARPHNGIIDGDIDHPDARLIANAPTWLAELLGQLAAKDAEIERLRTALQKAREAIRLTQEYIGPDLLPPLDGWSWFEGIKLIDAALAGTATPAEVK